MYLAGMGTLGLNASILTPEFGPRVFVTSIITDAPLVAGKPMDEELCTRCGLCVELLDLCHRRERVKEPVRVRVVWVLQRVYRHLSGWRGVRSPGSTEVGFSPTLYYNPAIVKITRR